MEVLPDEPAENETADVAAVAVPVRRKIVVRYKFSFRAKLIQAPRELQARFGEFADRSEGVQKSKVYRKLEAGAHIFGKKHACACALQGAQNLRRLRVGSCRIRGIEIRRHRRLFRKTVRENAVSSQTYQRAKDTLCERAVRRSRGKIRSRKRQRHKTDFYLPFRTTEELIKVNLVKLLSSGDITGDAEVVKADIADLIRDKITLAEAGISLSDEVAAEYMETADDMAAVRKPVSRGRRAIINIDTLAPEFRRGRRRYSRRAERKETRAFGRRITESSCRGLLDKPLTVEADDFSIDAVKMILLTGGRPVKI